MAQLRQDHEKFVEQETEIIVVGRENAEAFTNYWQKNDLPFIGLPDPTLSVLRQYGQEVNIIKLGRMPAQLIIDKQGTVRYAHYGNDASDIPSNEEILNLLETMNGEFYVKH
jgi:peroxiredoxin